MLETIIIILLILLLLSLFSGLVFLFSDRGNPNKKRTLYMLGIRVSLAAAIIILIFYGVSSGQLGNQNPFGYQS
tara:strand:+ start:338 stop:559 length:222 start_codon:yes stop_codon:yes gene_type:complete